MLSLTTYLTKTTVREYAGHGKHKIEPVGRCGRQVGRQQPGDGVDEEFEQLGGGPHTMPTTRAKDDYERAFLDVLLAP